MICSNFIKYCMSEGGEILPLLLDSQITKHTGICNPSIIIDKDSNPLHILRNVNYALWNCDNENTFSTPYGDLAYITPSSDLNLRTKNFLVKCDISKNEFKYNVIDTSKFDTEPQWGFIGLEDARLVRWDNKLYITGVRRDNNSEGKGRFELSQIDENGIELSRLVIESPEPDSYCEKNWMPIVDLPYHYIRWCNPLQIIKVNPNDGSVNIVVKREQFEPLSEVDGMQLRGSSQVLKIDGYYIAIIHMCHLGINEKKQKTKAGYYHQFLVWDKNWDLVKQSPLFKFANFGIEFTTGMAFNDDKFYIPFALQDSFSFLTIVPKKIIFDFIFNDNNFNYDKNLKIENNILYNFFDNTCDSYNCYELGLKYFKEGHYASSMVCFERACEYNTFEKLTDMYNSMYMCGLSLYNLPETDEFELNLWAKMINLCPQYSESYYMLSEYYYVREQYSEAFMHAKLAYDKNNFSITSQYNITPIDVQIQYIKCLYCTEKYQSCEELLHNLLKNNISLTTKQLEAVNLLLDMINKNNGNRVRVL